MSDENPECSGNVSRSLWVPDAAYVALRTAESRRSQGLPRCVENQAAIARLRALIDVSTLVAETRMRKSRAA